MKLLVVFARTYPRRTAAMLACLVAAGLAEGIGLSSLIPLIGMAAEGTASAVEAADQHRLFGQPDNRGLKLIRGLHRRIGRRQKIAGAQLELFP